MGWTPSLSELGWEEGDAFGNIGIYFCGVGVNFMAGVSGENTFSWGLRVCYFLGGVLGIEVSWEGVGGVF